MSNKILISTPVSNRDWILPFYLKHIYNIQYNKKLIDIYWIVNNSNDHSLDLLLDFQNKYKNEYNSITIDIDNYNNMSEDERTKIKREKYTYHWLSILRNKILKKCVKLNCDYLFSSDSDILVKPDILNRLMSHNENIVASLIYNGYKYVGIEQAYKYTNILREVNSRTYEHIVNYKIKNPDKNPVGTIIPVDFTGACVLMSKDVCNKTSYSWHIQGEDEPWSFSARQAGFKLYCDISMYSQHVMSPDLLEMFKDF